MSFASRREVDAYKLIISLRVPKLYIDSEELGFDLIWLGSG